MKSRREVISGIGRSYAGMLRAISGNVPELRSEVIRKRRCADRRRHWRLVAHHVGDAIALLMAGVLFSPITPIGSWSTPLSTQ